VSKGELSEGYSFRHFRAPQANGFKESSRRRRWLSTDWLDDGAPLLHARWGTKGTPTTWLRVRMGEGGRQNSAKRFHQHIRCWNQRTTRVEQAYQNKIQAVSNFGTDVSSNFFGCREMAKKIKTMSILVNGHTSRGKENIRWVPFQPGGLILCLLSVENPEATKNYQPRSPATSQRGPKRHTASTKGKEREGSVCVHRSRDTLR